MNNLYEQLVTAIAAGELRDLGRHAKALDAIAARLKGRPDLLEFFNRERGGDVEPIETLRRAYFQEIIRELSSKAQQKSPADVQLTLPVSENVVPIRQQQDLRRQDPRQQGFPPALALFLPGGEDVPWLDTWGLCLRMGYDPNGNVHKVRASGLGKTLSSTFKLWVETRCSVRSGNNVYRDCTASRLVSFLWVVRNGVELAPWDLLEHSLGKRSPEAIKQIRAFRESPWSSRGWKPIADELHSRGEIPTAFRRQMDICQVGRGRSLG